ncbi:IPT/TIG domain-containing protein [Streptomyces sp. MCA2]|nr:IPT/TIG domain-containing protein [Streptomyces sp. MCA2]
MVTINGTGLTGATVTFNGVPATAVSVNPAGTQITATTPPGSPGTAVVTVTTPGGTATLACCFTYQAVVTPHATSLTATPALIQLFPLQLHFPFLTATLTDTVTGLPVPGQVITFSTGGHFLGTAITDANGTASLVEILSLPLIILNGGYDATFAGTPTLQPSTAHAPFLAL